MLALVTVSLLLLGVRILPCSGCEWTSNQIQFRELPMHQALMGITSVSVGPAGVWGIGGSGRVYRKFGSPDGGHWSKQTGPQMSSLDVGKDDVWGIGINKHLYCDLTIDVETPTSRFGLDNPFDTNQAQYEDVTVSPNGYVWAVLTNKKVYFRKGVGYFRKEGTEWRRVGSGMKRLSAGASGLWGVDETGQVWYLVGTYGDTGASGTSWVKVPNLGVTGKVKHISVGDGFVLAVNEVGTVWKRGGVSSQDPDGNRWDQVANYMREVDTWNCYVWGTSTGGNVKWARLGTES